MGDAVGNAVQVIWANKYKLLSTQGFGMVNSMSVAFFIPQLRCPMHKSETTDMLCCEVHSLGMKFPHVPYGVPKLAKSTEEIR